MMKRHALFLVLMIVASALSITCNDTSEPCFDCYPPPPQPFKALTKKDNVLTNVEAAYNYRRIDKYDQALDDNFTFFLSTRDINNGLPAQWDRATDMLYNDRLFDKNYAALPCQSVFMDIKTEDGVQWTEFNPESAPTEKWYETQPLYYNFKFEVNPNTYIPQSGSSATFTVRNAGTDEEPHWQLVEMKDLGGASMVTAAGSTATYPSTWGSVKALYR